MRVINNELCMIRPTFIGLILFEIKYYPFMISLGKCSRSYNSIDDLSPKMYVCK